MRAVMLIGEVLLGTTDVNLNLLSGQRTSMFLMLLAR